ncbi:MAG: ABC transporter ATP-binding protein/permease [Chitinophagales bacterium]|nr:ABC transporter ATP-binding protein/permease [Chitinophagales bacterium]
MADKNTDLSYYHEKLFSFFLGFKHDLVGIYLFSIYSAIVNLSLPLGIQGILNFAMSGMMSTSIIVIISLVVIAVFFSGFLNVKVMNIVERLQQKIFVKYSHEFTEKLLKLDISKNATYNLPELVNRIFDSVMLQKSLSKVLLDLPQATIKILAGVILLSFYHSWFLIYCLFVIVIVFLILRFTANKGIKTSLYESDAKYNLADWIENLSNANITLLPYQSHQIHVKRTDTILLDYLEHKTKHFKTLKSQYYSILAFKILSTSGMLIMSTYLLVNQKINIGAFVAVELVIMTLIGAVEKLIKSLEYFYDIITSLVKLDKVLSLKEAEDSRFLNEMCDVVETIKLEEISYKTDNFTIIDNLSFTVEKGKIYEISGPINSGKSTLAKLISGILPPTSGYIYLNEHRYSFISNEKLYAHFGLYLSDFKLIKGTILENITLNNLDLTLDVVISIARKVKLYDLFKDLPYQLETQVFDNQSIVSYSMKKAILILRILSHNPPVMLFEMPFQSMSQDFIQSFSEYLNDIKHNKIIFFIGHEAYQNGLIDFKIDLAKN